MTDWTEARKSGAGVQITSVGMWNEYQKWVHEQECEECGARYKDKLPWKFWVTETLCYQCWQPGVDDNVPDEFLTKTVRAQKYAFEVRERNPMARQWVDKITNRKSP